MKIVYLSLIVMTTNGIVLLASPQSKDDPIVGEVDSSVAKYRIRRGIMDQIERIGYSMMSRAGYGVQTYSSMKAPIYTLITTAGLLLAVTVAAMAAGAMLFDGFQKSMSEVNSTLNGIARSDADVLEIRVILDGISQFLKSVQEDAPK
ncbi:Uncharacterised protein g10352 [Pycnogonum litorale]